jgi:hypothetical protein
MNESEIRDLLASLVFALRNTYLDREAMLATLRAAAKRTKLLEDWESEYKNLCLNPPGSISERVSEIFQPLIDAVTQGLSEKDLQELLAHARKLDQTLQSYDRK